MSGERNMKTLILTILLSLSSQTFAATNVKLQKGDRALSNITSGKVVRAVMKMNPNCPINALCAPATEVTIEVPLNGCVDRLGPVASKVQYNEVSGKYDITLSAVNIATKTSMVARCIKMPTAFIKVMARPFLDKEDFNLELLY